MDKSEASFSVQWLRGLNEKEKQDYRQLLKHNIDNPIILRLIKILEEKEKDLISSMTRPESFDNASWSSKQAYNLGAINALRQTRQLLDNLRTTTAHE